MSNSPVPTCTTRPALVLLKRGRTVVKYSSVSIYSGFPCISACTRRNAASVCEALTAMSSRFSNKGVANLDDEVLGYFVLRHKTLNKLSLACRYPEANSWECAGNITYSGEVVDALYVTTIMPAKIRTLSGVVPNDDHHRIHPAGVLYSSQPFLQGLTDIRSSVVPFESVALLTNTSLDQSQFRSGDAGLSWCARAVSRHLSRIR